MTKNENAGSESDLSAGLSANAVVADVYTMQIWLKYNGYDVVLPEAVCDEKLKQHDRVHLDIETDIVTLISR